MSRRFAACAAVATLAASVGPLAVYAGAATRPPTPKAGCYTVGDPAGDGSFDGETPNNPDLDALGLALDATKTDLIGYVKIAKLAAGPGSTDGARYTLDFTFNGHVFSASGSTYSNGSGAIRDGLAQSGMAGHVVQLGVDVPQPNIPPSSDFVTDGNNRGYVPSGLKVTFDTKHSAVVFDLPTKDIVKYGKAAFKGYLTAIDVKTQTDDYVVGNVWDTVGPLTGWKVGANTCFPKKKKG
jgi:hypothetical protein